MQLLIDTHILIWFLEGNQSLSKQRRQIVADTQNNVFISIASLWEMAVKISIGKLTPAQSLADVIKIQIVKERFSFVSKARMGYCFTYATHQQSAESLS